MAKFKPTAAPRAVSSESDDWTPASCTDVLVRYFKEPTGEPYTYPHHLRPLVELFDRCVSEGSQEAAAHAPVQHGKTQLTLAFLIFFALRKPGCSHIYSTYSATRADEVRLLFEGYALAAGLAPQGSGDTLRLRGGTTIRFVSAEGAITGNPCTGVAVVDDPFKGWSDANSRAHRTRVQQNYDAVIGTRVHPGASRIVLAARWHPDDLTGYVTRDQPASDDAPASKGFAYLRIPAECDDPDNDPLGRKLGEAAWPEKRPKAWLGKRKRNKSVWAALYQGDPINAADLKFGPAHYWEELPDLSAPRRHGYGMDLAFTAKSRSDHSCFIRGFKIGPRLYITDMIREKTDPEQFKAKVWAAYSKNPAPCVWFTSGPEIAWAARYRRLGMRLRSIPTARIGDKLARATLSGLLDAWNSGEVLLPPADVFPWAAEIEEEVSAFTGRNDASDDIVDALAGLAQAVELAREHGATAGDGVFFRIPGFNAGNPLERPSARQHYLPIR